MNHVISWPFFFGRWLSATVIRPLLCLSLLVLGLGGCVRYDYAVEVRGALVNGQSGEAIEGRRVIVKVGEAVIYDGYTDADGTLSFTYEGSVPRRGGRPDSAGDGEAITVVFQVETGSFGVVDVPVTLGHTTDVVSLGELQMGPTGEVE